MHPLWLTFKHEDLEEKFEKEQCRQRVNKEFVLLCFLVLVETCSLLRLARLEGIFSVKSIVQFYLLPLPLVICAWSLRGADAANRPDRRRKVLTLAKLVYMPSMCYWLLPIVRVSEDSLNNLYTVQRNPEVPNGVWLYLFWTLTGGFGTSFISSIGTRVPLKTQFLITVVGSAVNTWNVRIVTTLYILQYPGGKEYFQYFAGAVDDTSNTIASLLEIDRDYLLSERYPCQMCAAFVYMFLVVGVTLCIQWWNEFVDREKFLQRKLVAGSRMKSDIVLDESFLLRSGFGIDNFIGGEWTTSLATMVVCCMFAVCWRCTGALFHLTNGVWFEEVWIDSRA